MFAYKMFLLGAVVLGLGTAVLVGYHVLNGEGLKGFILGFFPVVAIVAMLWVTRDFSKPA